MKKILILFAFALMLCTAAQAKRVGVYCFFADNGEQLYEDENIQLYVGKLADGQSVGNGAKGTSSKSGGKTGVVIVNKTNKVIYIDKANSFFTLNGETKSYFQNAAYSTGQSTSTGASMNMGGLAKSMGIGGVAGGALSGLTVGGGSTATNTTTIFEQRVIGIAPGTAQVLTEVSTRKSLSEAYIKGGGDGLSKATFNSPREKLRLGAARHYTAYQSPLSVKASIKYSLKETFEEESSVMATAGNFIEHIVIDNHKGLKDAGADLRYCAPYREKNCCAYKANTNKALVVSLCVGGGIVLMTEFVLLMYVAATSGS
ncbi:MAG: hypothetical protein IJP70_05445 [Bacteroidales bacterium]|nr:hypothetical protein [Bacteroidales bacterium]